MNHKKIEEKEIIEKYILHQLTDDEETWFEEHLLYCKKCREDLVKSENIIYGIQSNILDKTDKKLETNNNFGNHKNYFSFYRAAAAILIISAIGIATYLIINKNNSVSLEKQIVSQKNDTTNIEIVEQNQLKHYKQKQIVKDENIKTKSKELIVGVYDVSPTFENAIVNNYRSENLKVLLPKKSEKFSKKNKLAFKWTSEKYKSLNLVIFNNREEIIFEKEITSPFEFENNLKPGLYYWQLETEDEEIYISKFIISNF